MSEEGLSFIVILLLFQTFLQELNKTKGFSVDLFDDCMDYFPRFNTDLHLLRLVYDEYFLFAFSH